MIKISVLALLLTCLVTICYESSFIKGEQIKFSVILPKLQAIHEDAQTLLIKNSELKAKILAGLQAQNEFKLRQAKETISKGTIESAAPQPQIKQNDKNGTIDYGELEEFNKWVDINLDYAVKNTQASIEAFKEEAQQSNGNVDYSEQAIKDGIEGVKHWQAAVIFQDKTLKEEKLSTNQSV